MTTGPALLLLAALASAAPAGSAAPASRGSADAERDGERAHHRSRRGRHLVAVIALGPSGPTIRSWRIVEKAFRRESATRSRSRVQVEDSLGNVLFDGPVRGAGDAVRELPGPAGAIETVVLPDPSPAVLVRVPVSSAATVIRLISADGRAVREIARVPYPESAR